MSLLKKIKENISKREDEAEEVSHDEEDFVDIPTMLPSFTFYGHNWVVAPFMNEIFNGRFELIQLVNNATITISAGNGLVNGGDFTTNQSDNETITLDIGAGSGISVTADAVAVDSTVVRTSGDQIIAGEKTLTDKLTVEGSVAGATIFDVQGTSGQLFSIVDSLTASLFSVNDISGLGLQKPAH